MDPDSISTQPVFMKGPSKSVELPAASLDVPPASAVSEGPRIPNSWLKPKSVTSLGQLTGRSGLASVSPIKPIERPPPSMPRKVVYAAAQIIPTTA